MPVSSNTAGRGGGPLCGMGTSITSSTPAPHSRGRLAGTFVLWRRDKVHSMLRQFEYMWQCQLDSVTVTQHRIDLEPGVRPMRLTSDRAGHGATTRVHRAQTRRAVALFR